MIFFFNDTATTEIYTLSLHDALPISRGADPRRGGGHRDGHEAGALRQALRVVGLQRAVSLAVRRSRHGPEFREGVSPGSRGRPADAPRLASLHGRHRGGAGLPAAGAPGLAPTPPGGAVEVRHRPHPGGRARFGVGVVPAQVRPQADADRESTRLNSSHGYISYA